MLLIFPHGVCCQPHKMFEWPLAFCCWAFDFCLWYTLSPFKDNRILKPALQHDTLSCSLQRPCPKCMSLPLHVHSSPLPVLLRRQQQTAWTSCVWSSRVVTSPWTNSMWCCWSRPANGRFLCSSAFQICKINFYETSSEFLFQSSFRCF